MGIPPPVPLPLPMYGKRGKRKMKMKLRRSILFSRWNRFPFRLCFAPDEEGELLGLGRRRGVASDAGGTYPVKVLRQRRPEQVRPDSPLLPQQLLRQQQRPQHSEIAPLSFG